MADFTGAGPVRVAEPADLPYSDEALRSLARASASLIVDQGEGCLWLPGFDALGQGVRDVRMCGPALTVDARPGDNVAIRMAIEQIRSGQILVIAGKRFAGRALIGEILARQAVSRGAAGFLIEGAVRDAAQLAMLSSPTYCVGRALLRATKGGFGEVGFPVSISNEVVYPGDVVLADDDGVAVIRQEYVERLAPRIAAAVDYETDRLSSADRGTLDMGVSGVRRVVAEG